MSGTKTSISLKKEQEAMTKNKEAYFPKESARRSLVQSALQANKKSMTNPSISVAIKVIRDANIRASMNVIFRR